MTLHVPASAIIDYKATKPWSEFGIIIGEEKLNIGEIRSKDGNGCYYDLNGNKFDSPKSGVNILKLENGQAIKVVIK